MKTIPIFSLLITAATLNCSAQTSVPPGLVSGTWTLAGSPYLIQGSIQIANSTTLTIDPGVTVNFQGTYKLVVLGRLLAIGTSADTIIFTAANATNGWRGIRFDNTATANDSSKIMFCKLQYGKATGVSPDNKGGAFYLDNFGKVIISNCRITNCSANYSGGGIYCNSSSPIISNNIILNNTVNNSGKGGGIYCYNSSPLISNNIISNNTISGVSEGGGIYCEGGNNIIITNNTFSNNTAYFGGGIYGYVWSFNTYIPLIRNNIISYNTASYGGGLYFDTYYFNNYKPNISDNTISNNTASNSGGGIFFNDTGPNALINNTITNNTVSSATKGGGGISFYRYSPDPSDIITNNTIGNNSATNGGAIYCENQSDPTFRNCILWGNTATNGAQVFMNDETSDPNFYYCDVQGGSAAFVTQGNLYIYTGTYQNNINSNPSFVAPSAGSGTGFNGVTANWSLQGGSPCINAGDPATTNPPATDKAGNPRISGCRIDVGAYEYQQNSLTATVSSTNATCNAVCNGAASATVTNGTAPYTYSWSGGCTTSSCFNLCAGIYTLNVIDATGCNTTSTVTISNITTISVSSTQTNVSCNGGNNGSATANPANGTAPYTYQWNNGQSTQTATGLSAGNYNVIVTGANGCTVSNSITITQPPSITVSSSQTNVSCNGGNNGSATVTPSGGTSPYTYLWNPSGQNTQTATGLSAGGYNVVVTDANGCTVAQSVPITQPSALSITAGSTQASCSTCPDGTATVNPAGGTPGYTYLWNPSGQNTQTATGLLPGTYTVCVTDANGCKQCSTVAVTFSTGINEVVFSDMIFIYPNPTSGKFTLNSKITKGEIFIHNIFGEKISTSTINHQTSTIDISSQPSGIYFLHIKTNEGTANQKLIIQK